MGRIHRLSSELANQIAAGEVVERPASLVKELVENALDAGATRVRVDIETGGTTLVRVSDDGEGMAAEDALLALERHATSKITAFDDLHRLHTFGFRGEALPSIASVSRLTLSTRQRGASEGLEIVVEGGATPAVKPAGRAARGTTVEVRDLFFNVPARRKFLKASATESAHVGEVVLLAALARHDVTFTLTRDGKPAREYLRAASRARAREAGARAGAAPRGVRRGARAHAHRGVPLAAGARAHRSAGAAPVRQRTAHQGSAAGPRRGARVRLGARWRALPGGGRVPGAAARHRRRERAPAEGRGALRGRARGVRRGDAGAVHGAGEGVRDPGARTDSRRRLAPPLPTCARSTRMPRERWRRCARSKARAHAGGESLRRRRRRRAARSDGAPAVDGDGARSYAGAGRRRSFTGAAAMHRFASWRRCAGRFSSAKEQDGLYVSINTPRRSAHVRAAATHVSSLAGVAMQQLLVPEVVELSPNEVAMLAEHDDEVSRLGVEVRAVGTHSVAVHGVPDLLVRARPERLVRDLVAEVQAQVGRFAARSISCSRPWRATARCARATPSRRRRRRRSCARSTTWTSPGHCPHGRPLVMRMPFASSSAGLVAEAPADHERRVARGVELALEDPARLLCVVGPTASGKTELAVDICERVNGEIDPGRQRADLSRVRHRLGQALGRGARACAPSPRRRARSARDRRRDDLWHASPKRRSPACARGKLPVICGGTFFWVRALVIGLAPAPSAHFEVRARHRAIALERGRDALHAELARVDPASAERLHPNDVVRVSLRSRCTKLRAHDVRASCRARISLAASPARFDCRMGDRYE